MTTHSKSNATVLITGASSGIGYEFARLFASHGNSLILVARTSAKLEEMKQDLEKRHSIQVVVLPIDLSLPDAAQRIFDYVKKKGLQVDVLINNAGLGDYGRFSEASWDKQAEMIQVNVTALTQLTHLFLPGMLERKSGKIMNVASTAAFQPGPLMSVYYATKAYVLHFTEAISNELRGTSVQVTALCPGPTESGFQVAAKLDGSRLVAQRKLPTSAEVAEYGYRALEEGAVVAIPGFSNRALVWSLRLMPRSLVRILVGKAQEPSA